jgi:hypothetical protein
LVAVLHGELVEDPKGIVTTVKGLNGLHRRHVLCWQLLEAVLLLENRLAVEDRELDRLGP